MKCRNQKTDTSEQVEDSEIQGKENGTESKCSSGAGRNRIQTPQGTVQRTGTSTIGGYIQRREKFLMTGRKPM
jgi:hypothetical protein